MKITGRSSSITNAFINAIIPVVNPSAEEVQQALNKLGMTPENFQCAYCGSAVSEWDHFRPLVHQQKPTGYISEIHNLVPSCGKCNQSKGNKEWKEWITSDAKLSPKTRGIKDLAQRIERLEAYEQWGAPTKIHFEAIVGQETWQNHWQNWEKIQVLMREAQKLAEKIKQQVASEYQKSSRCSGIRKIMVGG